MSAEKASAEFRTPLWEILATPLVYVIELSTGYFKEPTEQTFGTHYQWKTVHGTRKLVKTKDTFQYIPLLDVLQAMLKNDLIFKEVHILITYVYEKQFSYYFIIHFKVMHGHQ